MSQESQDEYFMALALEQAKKADALNEVPVGAIVVLDGEVIGEGYNQPISGCDPTAHAEIMALRQAANNVNNYRLVNADLFVTIEPCTMCAGAIVHSRIRRLVYGATEPKAGVVHSQQRIFTQPYFNHRVEVVSGILLDQCTDTVQAFFKRRRAEKKQAKKTKNI